MLADFRDCCACCCVSIRWSLWTGHTWPSIACDHVKCQVRAAAVTLARGLRGLTLRVTDRAQSSEADAAAAVAVALPLLLEKGTL